MSVFKQERYHEEKSGAGAIPHDQIEEFLRGPAGRGAAHRVSLLPTIVSPRARGPGLGADLACCRRRVDRGGPVALRRLAQMLNQSESAAVEPR